MVGYALRWGDIARVRKNGDIVDEMFRRGAFAASIAAGNVRLCVDHDYDSLVACQAGGSLRLIEDAVGLLVDAIANNTDAGDIATASVRCRGRAGLSVGFVNAIDRVFYRGEATAREVIGCQLREISVVRNPAYTSSEISAGKMRIERFLAASAAANRVARDERLAAAEAAVRQRGIV
jgi:HK97 family phage prohead protease